MSQVAAATDCWRDTECRGPATAAFPGNWDKYNYSPSSRIISPEGIFLPPDFEKLSGPAKLNSNGSQLIYDFGKEVAGIVTVTYNAKGSGNLGLAFSEARNYSGVYSDSSGGAFNPPYKVDGALIAEIVPTAEANYTMPDPKTRGGFRYLTLFSQNDGIDIEIMDVSLEISFQPDWSNLQAYRGYFFSSDDLLNRIWYSGAYTLQTNAIPPSQGRAFPILGSGWSNDQNLNLGTNDPVIYVDGSKRDRTVWAGDLAIAIPSILVSTGDWSGVRNTLQVMFNDQNSEGALPFAGPAINIYNSDTYHCATLIGTYDYFIFTNDKDFLSGVWDKYKKAMSFITAKIDQSGLLNVTGTEDWGRIGQGNHNSEANMLMYHTLSTGSAIATWMGDSALSQTWSSQAATLKSAANELLYDSNVGAFFDAEDNKDRYPEDANAMALFFSAALPDYISRISQQLTTNWTPIGAVAPELPDNLVGFVQSFEVKGHLVAKQASRALDLIRRAWGWYLNNPFGTGSTCIEGYLADGTFGYRATTGYGNDYSYTSHAHGWSTGPVDALTSFVAGMQLVQPGGSEWRLAPQFGDLSSAEAGFTTPLGKFSAKWALVDGGYSLEWDTPAGTEGTLVIPASKTQPKVTFVEDSNEETSLATGKYDADAETFTFQADGGKHIIQVVF